MRAVNLLPADLRGAVKAPASVNSAPEDGGGSGAFFALGALALCVVALAGYVLTTNEIKQQQADLDQITARSEAVTREVASLKPYADFQAQAETRISTVRDLATQRFDWERSLRDLARALPQDVTVKKLSGSISADAGADSPLRGAISAPAITLDGCTRDQDGVARVMARIRAVSGVTRVSLAKSDKAATTSAAGSIDAAAPTANDAAGCSGVGKDQAPDFQIVAFFEGDVAATAAKAATTPGAAPVPVAQDAATASTSSKPAAASGTTTPPADGSTPAPTTEGAK
jgi:Tfp pilus assembly protein PilN